MGNYYAQQDTNITLSMIASALGSANQAASGVMNSSGGSKGSLAASAGMSIAQAGMGALQAGLNTFGGLSVQKSQPDQSRGASNVGGVNYNMETMDFWIIHKRLHWGYVVKLMITLRSLDIASIVPAYQTCTRENIGTT